MTASRQAANRRAMEATPLDASAQARLRRAWVEDRVPERDLARRFSIPLAEVKEIVKDLTRAAPGARELT